MNAAPQHQDDADLRLVGRGLAEGLAAGAVLGPTTLVLPGLSAGLYHWASNPGGGVDPTAGSEVLAYVGTMLFYGPVAAMIGAPLGLVGAMLALVSLRVVASWSRRPDWTVSPAVWLTPAVTVGLATGCLALVMAWSTQFLVVELSAAAVAAVPLTAWRVRRAVEQYSLQTGRRR